MWCANYEISNPLKAVDVDFPPIRESKICKYEDIDSCEAEMSEYLYDRCEDYIEAIRNLLRTFGVDELQIDSTINEWIREILIWTEFEEIDPKEYYES